jgi:hypothetical protein
LLRTRRHIKSAHEAFSVVYGAVFLANSHFFGLSNVRFSDFDLNTIGSASALARIAQDFISSVFKALRNHSPAIVPAYVNDAFLGSHLDLLFRLNTFEAVESACSLLFGAILHVECAHYTLSPVKNASLLAHANIGLDLEMTLDLQTLEAVERARCL